MTSFDSPLADGEGGGEKQVLSPRDFRSKGNATEGSCSERSWPRTKRPDQEL